MDEKNFRETITIKYDGLTAATGQMPIDDLIESLTGWKNYFEITSSIYFGKDFSSKKVPPESRPKVNVQALKKGSFEVPLIFEIDFNTIVSIIGLGLAVKNDAHITKTISNFARWFVALYKKQVEEKKAFHTLDEVVKSLTELAKEYDINPGQDESEKRNVVELLDNSLKRATKAIEHSAETITINGTKEFQELQIEVDAVQKRALQNYFYFEKKDVPYFPAEVIVRSLHLDTRHCKVFVDKCNESRFRTFQTGYIRDNSIEKAKNAYSLSLYKQSLIQIWVLPEVDAKTNEVIKWYFYNEEPIQDTPLFDTQVKED